MDFVARAMWWGLLLGAGVGFAFQIVFLGPVGYGLFGLALGGFTGLSLGILNGVVIGTIRLRLLDTGIDVESQRDTIARQAAFITLIGSGLLIFGMVFVMFSSVISALMIALPASLFAALMAYYAAHRLDLLPV